MRVKTWSVFLEADGLEEAHESFTVVLKNPQNALLGPLSSASVEIIDPRGGEDNVPVVLKLALGDISKQY